MNTVNQIAQAALRLAVLISPTERREWSLAMQAEILNISSDKALPFALGCLWAMVHARATDGNTLLIAARWTSNSVQQCRYGREPSLYSTRRCEWSGT